MMSKHKVIGRYRSISSGGVYDFISKTSAIVVKSRTYTVGRVIYDLYPYDSGNFERISTPIYLGGE